MEVSVRDKHHHHAIQTASKVLKAHLQKSLLVHFEKIEQSAFDDKEASGIETIALDLKVLQKSSKYLPSLYIDSIIKNLQSFFENKETPKDRAFFTSSDDKGATQLQLLDVDEIDTQLLINRYVDQCESKVSSELSLIQTRLEHISNVKEISLKRNPFGPSVLLNTYVEMLKGESLSKDFQQVMWGAFSDAVFGDYKSVLEEVNTVFIENGVLSNLSKTRVKKTTAPAKPKKIEQQVSADGPQTVKTATKTENTPQAANVASSSEPSTNLTSSSVTTITGAKIEPELFHSLVEMATSFREKASRKKVSDGLVVTGEELPTKNVVASLSELQQQKDVDLNESVRARLGMHVQVDGQRQPYSEQDDILIDVVAMFFDVILQDRHLPDAVRAMIAQLQIPVLKVAMIDKNFFAKKSHPARMFLNTLSSAGLGISEQNNAMQSAMFKKMEELVDRVLMEFEEDVSLFAELNEEMEIFKAQQQQQTELIEERTQQQSKNSEKIELTKKRAAYEIAQHLEGKSIPEFVKMFLDDAWYSVLVLAMLREEREPEAVKHCIDVVDHLVTSVTVPSNEEQRNAILEILGSLVRDLKIGLENISYEFHLSAPFFKELEEWHRKLLATTEDHQMSVEEQVPMVDFTSNDALLSLEEEMNIELENELMKMPQDKHSKKANQMHVDDWVEYTNVEGCKLRARLSWKSDVTLNCLFVDHRGSKALELSVIEVAELLRNKSMKLLGKEEKPLVERVMAGMKQFFLPKETSSPLMV